ncbi:hypothetical protein ACVWYG_000721 [Pedobacter sp. UYEF25]
MAFKKLESGNPKGMEPGTIHLKTKIKRVVESNLAQLETDLQLVTPAERVAAITSLANFIK